MNANPEPPTLHFFRATPRRLFEQPPLASSLQTLETCFFLIALDRFPGAVVSCATAWESVIKAKLGISPEQNAPLGGLIRDIQTTSTGLRNYDGDKVRTFRETRNRIVHYGFSPKDDEECAVLLLETGLPFLGACYRELFDFYLDWRDIRPGITDFHGLSPEEMKKAGLLPDVAQQLRFATVVYRRAKSLSEINHGYCFRAFAHFIRLALKRSSMTAAEDRILENGDTGQAFEEHRKEKAALQEAFSHVTWEFDCPVCGGVESIVAKLDEALLHTGQVSLLRSTCVECHFVARHDQPFLAEVVLGAELEEKKTEILKEFGVK
jgi:hypothetical protein